MADQAVASSSSTSSSDDVAAIAQQVHISPPRLWTLDDATPEQRSAILHGVFTILLIMAPPGAGKTLVLILRALHIIQHPLFHGVLYLVSYTTVACSQIEYRLGLYRQTIPAASRIQVYTLHSIAYDLLQKHGHEVGYKNNFSILKDGSEKRLFLYLIEKAAMSTPISWVIEVWNAKYCMPTHRLSPQQLQQLLPPLIDALRSCLVGKLREKPETLMTLMSKWCRVYENPNSFIVLYREFLVQLGVMDFGLMLIKAIELHEKSPAARSYLKLDGLLTDETQDDGGVELKFLELITQGIRCVTMVADPHQTVYAWKDVPSETRPFDGLRDKWDPDVIELKTTHRLSKENTALANALKRIFAPEDPLIVANKSGPIPSFDRYEDEHAEAAGLVSRISRLLESGVMAHEILIVAKWNSFVKIICYALFRAGHMCTVLGKSQRGPYLRGECTDVIAFFRVVLGCEEFREHCEELYKKMNKIGECGAQVINVRNYLDNNEPLMSDIFDYVMDLTKYKSYLTSVVKDSKNDRKYYVDLLREIALELDKSLKFEVRAWERLQLFVIRMMTLTSQIQTPLERQWHKISIATICGQKGGENMSVHVFGASAHLFRTENSSLDASYYHNALDDGNTLYVGVTRPTVHLAISCHQSITPFLTSIPHTGVKGGIVSSDVDTGDGAVRVADTPSREYYQLVAQYIAEARQTYDIVDSDLVEQYSIKRAAQLRRQRKQSGIPDVPLIDIEGHYDDVDDVDAAKEVEVPGTEQTQPAWQTAKNMMVTCIRERGSSVVPMEATRRQARERAASDASATGIGSDVDQAASSSSAATGHAASSSSAATGQAATSSAAAAAATSSSQSQGAGPTTSLAVTSSSSSNVQQPSSQTSVPPSSQAVRSLVDNASQVESTLVGSQIEKTFADMETQTDTLVPAQRQYSDFAAQVPSVPESGPALVGESHSDELQNQSQTQVNEAPSTLQRQPLEAAAASQSQQEAQDQQQSEAGSTRSKRKREKATVFEPWKTANRPKRDDEPSSSKSSAKSSAPK